MIKLTRAEKRNLAIAGALSGLTFSFLADKVLNSSDESTCHEDGCLRVVQPGERKPYPLKNFLSKPTHELTVGDTFLMHLGNVSISVLVPRIVEGLSLMIMK